MMTRPIYDLLMAVLISGLSLTPHATELLSMNDWASVPKMVFSLPPMNSGVSDMDWA